jgi:hypothetical protein
MQIHSAAVRVRLALAPHVEYFHAKFEDSFLNSTISWREEVGEPRGKKPLKILFVDGKTILKRIVE